MNERDSCEQMDHHTVFLSAGRQNICWLHSTFKLYNDIVLVSAMSHLIRKSISRDSWLPRKFPKGYSCKKMRSWSNSKWITNLQNPDPWCEFYILLQHSLEGGDVSWWHINKWTLCNCNWWNCLGPVLGQQDGTDLYNFWQYQISRQTNPTGQKTKWQHLSPEYSYQNQQNDPFPTQNIIDSASAVFLLDIPDEFSSEGWSKIKHINHPIIWVSNHLMENFGNLKQEPRNPTKHNQQVQWQIPHVAPTPGLQAMAIWSTIVPEKISQSCS